MVRQPTARRLPSTCEGDLPGGEPTAEVFVELTDGQGADTSRDCYMCSDVPHVLAVSCFPACGFESLRVR